jgi:SRSO17 transposase
MLITGSEPAAQRLPVGKWYVREAMMAVDEQRVRIRRSIEEKLGVEEADYLIEGRPPGGWDALVTKEFLDLKLTTLEERMRSEFHRQTKQLLMWLVGTVFAAIVVASTLS